MAPRGIAGPRCAGRGAQGRRHGRVHRGRAALRRGAAQRASPQEQLGAGHGHADPARVLAARAARLPALRPAHGCLRRLQDAAPRCRGAGGGEAARARGQPLAPRQGPPREPAASARRPGLALPLPRAPFGAPRGQEGHGADRLPRAQEPLPGRHAGLSRAAEAGQPDADAAARADRLARCARHLPADRTGLRRRARHPGARHHRAGAAAPRAAVGCGHRAPQGLRREERSGAMVAAAQGARHGAAAGGGRHAAGLRAARVRRDDGSGPPISRRSIRTSIARSWARRCACSTCSPTNA